MTVLSYGGDIIPTITFFNLEVGKQKRIIECAIDEFSKRSFENVMLSNIIKNANISRGSLYQYFNDKTDLYLYLMEIAKKRKMMYIQEYLANPTDLPFIELFKNIYAAGIKFAIDNPRFVKMMSYLILNKGEIYDKVIKDAIRLAIELYSSLIDRDKKLGRIRKEIDTKVYAQLVVDMTMNISLDEINKTAGSFNYDKMLERATHIMEIIKYGVCTGN